MQVSGSESCSGVEWFVEISYSGPNTLSPETAAAVRNGIDIWPWAGIAVAVVALPRRIEPELGDAVEGLGAPGRGGRGVERRVHLHIAHAADRLGPARDALRLRPAPVVLALFAAQVPPAGEAGGSRRRGGEREEVESGQGVVAPGARKPYTKAEAEVYILSREEGGRHTPFFSGYKPQFFIRTSDITGECTLPEGVEMVMPGDNVKMTIELMSPVPIEEQMRFAIREGGRTVGSGVITKVLS